MGNLRPVPETSRLSRAAVWASGDALSSEEVKPLSRHVVRGCPWLVAPRPNGVLGSAREAKPEAGRVLP